MDVGKSSLSTRFLTSQITSLEFVGSYLLAGEGSYLHVYQISQHSSSYILKYKVFAAISIHGIRACNSEDPIIKLCVFGERCFKVLHFSPDPISVSSATASIKFQDWIWDVKWLCNGHIAVVLAQNYVISWNPNQMKQQEISSCEEKCILYCGMFLGDSWTNAVVFSGTVFKEILIWCPSIGTSSEIKHSACKIIHRLKGHDGVIFSITYNATLRKLCSSSDDRSIQIWDHHLPDQQQVPPGGEEFSHEEIWINSSFSKIFKLYGHEARVWKVLAVRNFYLSAGEDSMLCFWSADESRKGNQLINKVMCHAGSSIRSLCVNPEETLVASGGGDGGIKIWRLSQNENLNCSIFPIKLSSGNVSSALQSLVLLHDYPREVNLLDEQRLLIMTNEGILFCYNMKNSSISLWISDPKYKSYSVSDVMDRLQTRILVVIGDLYGDILILSTAKSFDDIIPEFQTVLSINTTSGKILALKMIDSDLILTCGTGGKMELWKLNIHNRDQGNATVVATLELPPCKQRWFSAATFISCSDMLICGCRDGSIHVYCISSIKKLTNIGINYPVESFYRLHGPNGVTDMHFDEDILYSTGRDGFIQKFQVIDCNLKKMHKIWIAGCPKWISGILPFRNELLISGFYTDNFILWSEKNETVLLKIPCGGGHRSWSFKLHHDKIATYAFIKGREIAFCKSDLDKNIPLPVKAGIHTRQICHVKYLFSIHDTIYLATASEDTTVKIAAVHSASSDITFTVLHTLKRHISSVKSCAISEWRDNALSSTKNVLFVTVGGRAQLICWQLVLCTEKMQNACDNSIAIFEIASHMLYPEDKHTKKPWEKQTFTYNPETRYMDVAVWNIPMKNTNLHSSLYAIAVACSDSYLRLFSLDTRTSEMKLLLADPLHEHCMLKVVFLRTILNRAILITTATDGKAIFWDLSHIEESLAKEDSENFDLPEMDMKSECQPNKIPRHVIASVQLHQSGITAVAVISGPSSSLPSQQIIMATGGDDAAICITVMEMLVAKPSSNLETCIIEITETHRTYLTTAHTAQVTGAYFISPEYLVTSSVDHRISVWHLSLSSNKSINITLLLYKVSNVADIASITGWRQKDNAHSICVGGNGVEICNIVV